MHWTRSADVIRIVPSFLLNRQISTNFICKNSHLTIYVFAAMEDAHAIELTLADGKPENAFFAVYDGHGGTSHSPVGYPSFPQSSTFATM